MTPYAVFVGHVRPLFERLVAEGLIGAWGMTGIGHPDTIIRLLANGRHRPRCSASPTCSTRPAG